MRAIITADWHLRKDLPRCRIDEDFWETQKKVVLFIVDQAFEKGLTLYIVGDIFDRSVVQEEIKTWLMKTLPIDTKMLAGQHDLPYHQWNNVDRSSFGILISKFGIILEAGNQSAPFGLDKKPEWSNPKAKIVFTHQLTFPTKKDQIIINGEPIGKCAQDLLDEYPEAHWIFTGDYHKHFHYENKGRHVVNPGCITRQASDFIDYKPIVYFVDTEKGIVEIIELPDTEDMVTDQYIKDEKARNERIESFITTIQDSGEVSLNFIDNLRDKAKGLKEGSQEVLMEIIEEVV